MPGTWQHKISQYDIPPPPEVWSKITDQLNEEYLPEEIILSQKMYDYEISPPVFMLDKVLDGLVSDQIAKPKARVFSFPPSRVAIAAVAIGLIAITLIYFVRPGSLSGTKNSVVTVVPIPRSNSGTPSSPDSDNITQRNTPPEIGVFPSTQPGSKKAEVGDISRSNRNTKRARLNPMLAANTISPISVSAPPIYDGDGNIIMDEDLVSAPDENYIIVTSPNGEQTKISRKFLKMLCVMNGGTDNYYMNAENFEWKLRFEEWRSKLLQQASYIPTANNFLDIMDLKELLQEN